MATEMTRLRKEEDPSIKEMIINIQGWIAYFLPRWWILLVAGILGGSIGLVYAFWKQPLYTATTTFVLESNDTKSGLGRISGMAALAGIELGGNASGLFQGDNILELYKSRRMLAQTLMTKVPETDELLVERYMAYSGIKESWKEHPKLFNLDFREDRTELNIQTRRLRDSVMNLFVKSIRLNALSVERVKKELSIIQVDVTTRDEVFSKAFNENLVEQVNNFYIQTKTGKSVNNISILEKKIDSVHAVMTDAIYSAARVSDATPNLNPTRQVNRIAPAKEAEFSAEANREMLSQLLQNLELTKMTLLQEQPLIQLVDQPVYPLKINRVSKIKSIVIGGFLFGLLTLISLMLLRYYREIMVEETDKP